MRLAILGSPVGHSLSPAMHNAALAYAGLDGGYEARDVDVDGFLGAATELRAGRLTGANVTMPHKLLAYEVCDEHTVAASRVGAVNTLTMAGSSLLGANTDVAGVTAAWSTADLPTEGPVVILGAGGAAAAAQVALAGRDLFVVARRPELAAAAVSKCGSGAAVLAWEEPIPPAVVVNATSLGMAGETLPEHILDVAIGLLDMPYSNEPTRAVRTMQARGLPVAGGLEMLVGQAVGSFQLWTGIAVPGAVFRKAAEQELLKRKP